VPRWNDAFYAEPADAKVFLTYAIMISFMEMADVPRRKL